MASVSTWTVCGGTFLARATGGLPVKTIIASGANITLGGSWVDCGGTFLALSARGNASGSETVFCAIAGVRPYTIGGGTFLAKRAWSPTIRAIIAGRALTSAISLIAGGTFFARRAGGLTVGTIIAGRALTSAISYTRGNGTFLARAAGGLTVGTIIAGRAVASAIS